MAHVLSPASTPLGAEKGKTGLRSALRKWKDRLKGQGASRPSSSAPSQDQHLHPYQNGHSHSSLQSQSQSQFQSRPALPPPRLAPDALFAPTTQTTIISPNDPRNASSPNSNSSSSSPQSTLRKRGSRLMRRNTAPADYFVNAHANTRLDPETEAILPLNTMTTTITATAAPPRQRPRYRLSLSKRESVQRVSSRLSVSRSASAMASPTPEALNRIGVEQGSGGRRAVSAIQERTGAQMVLEKEEEKEKGEEKEKEKEKEKGQERDGDVLVEADEVVRRDKPKDWLDAEKREKETGGLEERRKEIEGEKEGETENVK